MKTHIINGWLLIGQRNGKPHYRYIKGDNWHLTDSSEAPALSRSQRRRTVVLHDPASLPLISFDTVMALKPGDLCPKCRGSGIYRWYTPDQRRVRSSTCYWCNDARTGAAKPGKGWIDNRDLVFILDAAAEGRLSFVASA